MSKGATITKEIDLSFDELMTVIQALPRPQKLRLRKVLDQDIKPSRNGDEALLRGVSATFGEELTKPMTSAHQAVVAQSRRQRRDENARSADRMIEVQRETYRCLNVRRSKKG